MSEIPSINLDETHGKIRHPKTIIKRRRKLENRLLKTELSNTKVERDQANYRADEATKNSLIDQLTGLRNRRWFMEAELPSKLAQADRSSEQLWLVFYDFDRFKDYNTKYNLPGGDQILRLSKAFISRKTEEPARIGGDEFAKAVFAPRRQIIKLVSREIRRVESDSSILLSALPLADGLTEQDRISTATVSFALIRYTGQSVEQLMEMGSEGFKHAKILGGNTGLIVHGRRGAYQFDQIPKTLAA